ncbi:MAG: hydroxymethylbilane synthase [Flavobacteriaceae bacterium]|jgi:hydroxymethylbilane synthase
MIRIGTRKSALALWQANQVKIQLEELGHSCSLVPIESSGDQNLTEPIYAMGIQGVFTKSLDQALLSKKIDLAVHSLKDVPTVLPEGIEIIACLKRGPAQDVIVYHPDFENWEKSPSIGTGSFRRKAQWLRKHPHHRIENLRGNLQKRFEKLESSQWGGAVFAQAGLERLGLMNTNMAVLDWMIPAPAQGIIGVAARIENTEIKDLIRPLNCDNTTLCARVERSFLNTLEGGCTAPIGAHARIENNTIHFHAGLFSLDGSQVFEHKSETKLVHATDLGKNSALQLLKEGATQLMQIIKAELK